VTQNRKLFLLALVISIGFSKKTFAQNEGILEADSILSPIMIATFSGEMEVADYVGALELISRQKIESADQTSPLGLLNSVSGVYMHSGALNTNRITIRGIGARTPFSTNKLRAYYGQIPLTDGVGETTIEDIDISNWGQASILKGPVSSTYGSGLGGVLLIEPIHMQKDEALLKLNSQLGSFGLVKYGLMAGINRNNKSVIVSYSNQKSDGYRDNNKFQRHNFNLRASFKRKNSSFEVLGLFIDQFAEIPSSINETDYLNNPTKAGFTWNASQGFEDYTKYLAGITWTQLINASLDLKTSIYVNHKNNDEARPFNILKEELDGVGVRSAFYLGLNKSNIEFGSEFYTDNYRWMTYENLYEDNNGQGSLEGNRLTNNTEQRAYFNVFSAYNYSFSEHFKVDIGISASQTVYELQKEYPIREKTHYDYSWQVSPKVGFNYKPSVSFKFYGLISRGFSPPSLEETLTPDGNLNPEIRPEIGWNYEIGIDKSFFKNRVQLDIAMYTMYIKNLLVARRTGLDQFVGINAGKTRHAGIETTLNFQILRRNNMSLDMSSSISLNDFKFVAFEEGENVFDGNQLTGVPEETISGRIDLHYYAFSIALAHQFVAKMPITDDNQVYTTAYHIFNSSIGYASVFKNLKYRLNYRINNIFNTSYASMVAVNAQGFGGNAPRYYYPGLPTNHQISMTIDIGWPKKLSHD
jgi:iron complex outermembrane receptor protein